MDKRPEQFEGKAESGDKLAEKAPLAVPMKEERIQLAQVDTSAAAIPTVVADSKQTIPPSEVAASETAPILDDVEVEEEQQDVAGAYPPPTTEDAGWITAISAIGILAGGGSGLLGGSGPRSRSGTGRLHVLLQPCITFSQHVQDRLACAIAVRLVGQHHEARSAAHALDRGKHALALHGEGAGVVVFLAVDDQQCILDALGVRGRREGEAQEQEGKSAFHGVGLLPGACSNGLIRTR